MRACHSLHPCRGVSGHYAVLCALTGAAGSNQALLAGRTALSDHAGEKILREPFLKLRKGTLHPLPASASAATARLRSLSLPVVDQGGAGGKGQGQIINKDGKVIIIAEFDNKAREVLSGEP